MAERSICQEHFQARNRFSVRSLYLGAEWKEDALLQTEAREMLICGSGVPVIL